MMHSITWVIWLISILGALSSTRNPFHLLLILLILIIMIKLNEKNSAIDNSFQVSLFPLILILIFSTTLFNALVSHNGETMVTSIPGNIWLFSGPITLEAILYGFSNGVILSSILLAFMIFNQSLSAKSIIRMIPRAFFPLALMISIAMNFLPSIKRRLEEIRQVQAIRGHQLRHLPDYASLFLPLLTDGLERSIWLAEAMTARGFVFNMAQQQSKKNQFVIIGGLLVFMSGWFLQLKNKNGYALGLSYAGLMVVLFWFWWISRKIPHSNYKREKWYTSDSIISIIEILILGFYILPISFIDRQILLYNPYPRVTLPNFDMMIGVLSLAFLIPGFIKKKDSI